MLINYCSITQFQQLVEFKDYREMLPLLEHDRYMVSTLRTSSNLNETGSLIIGFKNTTGRQGKQKP